MLAVSPTHVRISHFVTPDVMMTFFVTLSALLSYRIITSATLWDYVLAGAAVGCATSAEYNARIAIALLIAAHSLREGKHPFFDDNLCAGIASWAVVFLFGSPYVFLDLPAFLNDLAFEMRHYSLLAEPGQAGSSLLWYLDYVWKREGVVALLAAIQIARAGLKRSKKAIYLGTFSLVYFLFVSSYAVRNDRTLGPILPLMSILAAILISDLVEAIGTRVTRLRSRVGRNVAGLAIVCSGCPPSGNRRRPEQGLLTGRR